MYKYLNQDFVQRPSKYTKQQKFLPSILLDKKPFNIRKVDSGEFDFDKHNTFIVEHQTRMTKNK